MKNKQITIGLIQIRGIQKPEANLENAIGKIQRAGKSGAQIVCLPELFSNLYFPQTWSKANFAYAENIPGKTTKILSQSARQNNVAIIAGLFEKTGGHFYNTAIVINPDGKILGKYRKMHIPRDPKYFMENLYFEKGNLGFRSFATQGIKVGAMICYDQWFPEAARATALKGAQILFYPTAIGWLSNESETKLYRQAWLTTQISHGIDNGVFIASVNRVGKEGDIKFWGTSFVSGPFGEIIAQASDDKEEVLIAKCNLNKIDSTRRGWPFFKIRRPDAY